MIDEKFIRPIPNYIAKQIRNRDERSGYNGGNIRFYAYFAKIKGELVKITVACKNYENQWFCKQVAVHGVHSDICFVRDMEYSIMGFVVGWYEQGLSNIPKQYEDGKWYSSRDKFYNPFAKVINKKYALRFDAYKYSAIDKYPYADELKYLRIYEQYPQAEYFVKLGLQHLATNKTLLKKAAKDKNFRKWLIRYAKQLRNEYGTYPYFSAKIILSSYKANISVIEGAYAEKERKELLKNYNYSNTISKIIPHNEIDIFLKYIKKQDTNIASYADYVKACTHLGLDMTLDKNKFPHDFKRWHDIRIDEYRSKLAEEDAEKQKALYEQFASIAEKYLPLERSQNDAYIVVIAKSPADLVREGDLLHHCVGRMNYDQRFIREESLIFFIRNKETPDTPFVTVEYSLSKHKVLQCYGDRDSKPTDEVLNFVHRKWLPYANKKLKSIAA